MAEWYGDIKKMPEDLLIKSAIDLRNKLDEAHNEIDRREGFTDAQKLADRLHRLLHLGVECDYDYSDWNVGVITPLQRGIPSAGSGYLGTGHEKV